MYMYGYYAYCQVSLHEPAAPGPDCAWGLKSSKHPALQLDDLLTHCQGSIPWSAAPRDAHFYFAYDIIQMSRCHTSS